MIAKRYNRDEETVCITLNHSAVIIMAGTFDGAYILTITSVSMISPSVNKRNSAVMTEWFSHNLGVPGNRGFIRFVDPDVSNYAIGGVTMLDLMEKEEKARTGLTERTELVREKSVVRSMSRQVSRKGADTPDSDKRPSTSCGRLAKKSVFNLFSRSQRASEGSEDDYRS